MSTVINIGTTKKNLVGVEIDKAFDDIEYKDIVDIVKEEFGDTTEIRICGGV